MKGARGAEELPTEQDMQQHCLCRNCERMRYGNNGMK